MSDATHYEHAEFLLAEGREIAGELAKADTQRRDELGKQLMGIWAQAQVHATLALASVNRPMFAIGDSIRAYSDTGLILASGKPFAVDASGFALLHGREMRVVPWSAVGYVGIDDHAVKPGEPKQGG